MLIRGKYRRILGISAGEYESPSHTALILQLSQCTGFASFTFQFVIKDTFREYGGITGNNRLVYLNNRIRQIRIFGKVCHQRGKQLASRSTALVHSEDCHLHTSSKYFITILSFCYFRADFSKCRTLVYNITEYVCKTCNYITY